MGALEPVKPKIDDVITQAVDKIVEVEDAIKKQLTEKILEALKPVQEQMIDVMTGLSAKIVPTAIKALEEVKPAVDHAYGELYKLAVNGGESTEEFEKANKEMLKMIEERIVKMLQDVTAVRLILLHLPPHVTDLKPFSPLIRMLSLLPRPRSTSSLS